MVGSSKTYVTSVSDEPRWRISLVRCASPPDSVPDGRSSDRYPSPISTNESNVCCRLASSGATDGSSEVAHPLGEVADLHRAGVGDADPLDLRRPCRRAQPCAAAFGTCGEGDRALHEGADVRLQRVDILGQERLLNDRDQALVSQVDPADLDLDRLLVEEVVQLGLGVVPDRLVRVKESRFAEPPHRPSVGRIAGDRQCALG